MRVRGLGWGALALPLAVLLAGCAAVLPAQPAAPLAPSTAPAPAPASWLPAGATVHRGLAYGTDPKQTLDVYEPAAAHGDAVILMVHGGGWTSGDKTDAGVTDNKVAHYLPEGFVFVSANYRLTPQVKATEEASDVASALAYVQRHASAWGGDAARVVLMGHSAGANLVCLVAVDPSYLARAGAAAPVGLVSLDSAAYDVPQIMRQPHLPLYDAAFGEDHALWQAASPTLNISGTPPPALLVCGTSLAGSCLQSHAFAAALTRHGGRVGVLHAALTHAEINSTLGEPGTLTDAVDAFLHTLGVHI